MVIEISANISVTINNENGPNSSDKWQRLTDWEFLRQLTAIYKKH